MSMLEQAIVDMETIAVLEMAQHELNTLRKWCRSFDSEFNLINNNLFATYYENNACCKTEYNKNKYSLIIWAVILLIMEHVDGNFFIH